MASSQQDNAILIEELELFVRIGVPEEERSTAQRLTLSLTLFPVGGFQNIQDEITNTINYATLCREVTEFVAIRNDKLIETLADAVAAHLLRTFPLRKIELELRKFILPEVKYVAVRLTRERSSEI